MIYENFDLIAEKVKEIGELQRQLDKLLENQTSIEITTSNPYRMLMRISADHPLLEYAVTSFMDDVTARLKDKIRKLKLELSQL